MKFTFKIQKYQTDAVKAVCDVFEGQPFVDGVKYIRDIGKYAQKQAETLGLGDDEDDSYLFDSASFKNNFLEISKDRILENIQEVQSKQNIPVDEEIKGPTGMVSLDIDMETGTGKTYVYINTMFELNKKYGWSKFIVVVPSIAIREGVKKSFETMEEHFMERYGKKARFFVYDSDNLQKIDSFSSSAGINVMIINAQAFNTMKEDGKSNAARIINTKRDEFGSRRPIDVIAANNPIIILDEPQKLGGKSTMSSLKRFNPLFTLNYSATHKVSHNMVYVLDALDAFNKKLVKGIQVKGFALQNIQGNSGFIYFDSIQVSKSLPRARMTIDVLHKSGIKRESKILGKGDSLYAASGNLAAYERFTISEIDANANTVTFLNGITISAGSVIGDNTEEYLRRIQIQATIKSHFEKEESLFAKGIKTLSLFFIDEVSKYRKYNDDGEPELGEYGKIFEEEYQEALNEKLSELRLSNPEYYEYLETIGSDPAKVHNGYFSIDKNKHFIDSKDNSETGSDDISAYDLILKNKERLLSFDEPTRFIFSHSALREGWDNPNIFQICTLKNSNSTTTKRQEVGRGMRLCVNQNGSRMDYPTLGNSFAKTNLLTIVASESYAEFADALQKNIKEDIFERVSKADADFFKGKTVIVDGKKQKITGEQADAIFMYLALNRYIDEEKHLTDSYKEAASEGTLAPITNEKLTGLENQVQTLIKSIYTKISAVEDMITDGNAAVILDNAPNANFEKEEFQQLWKRINHKYTYVVDFDSNELINNCIGVINDKLNVRELRYSVESGTLAQNLTTDMINSGDAFEKRKSHTEYLKSVKVTSKPYDLVGRIANEAIITRKTAVAILKGINSSVFDLYKKNPEDFIRSAVQIITEQKATMIVDHITYNMTDGTYDNDIFTAEKNSESFANAFKSEKSIQDYIFTDGLAVKSTERKFAEALERAEEVAVYAKLPRGFQIPTPVGNYAPDWAIAFKKGYTKHLYFIAETKGSLDSMNLREVEKAKIKCVTKLFNDLSDLDVQYHQVTTFEDLLDKIS